MKYPLPVTHAQKCNMMTVSRKSEAIVGSYVVDLSRSIPDSFLPPLSGDEPDGTRNNLRLVSQDSIVDAHVWVKDAPSTLGASENHGATWSYTGPGGFPQRQAQRTRLTFQASGSANVRLHSLGSRQPCSVVARSTLRSVTIAIPPEFRGMITTYSATLPTVPGSFTPLGEVGGEGRFFVGDRSALESMRGFGGRDGWTGSSLTISAPYGHIKVEICEDRSGLKFSHWRDVDLHVKWLVMGVIVLIFVVGLVSAICGAA